LQERVEPGEQQWQRRLFIEEGDEDRKLNRLRCLCHKRADLKNAREG
jgi:hypothetical protein